MFKEAVKKSQKGSLPSFTYGHTFVIDKRSVDKLNKTCYTGNMIKRYDISTRCADFGKKCPSCYHSKRGLRRNKYERNNIYNINKGKIYDF